MIDNSFILLSTLATVYIVLRAIMLDRQIPWFERVARGTAADTTPGSSSGKPEKTHVAGGRSARSAPQRR